MNARALRDAIVGVVGSDARGKMKKGKKVKGESRKKTKKKKTKKRGKAAALEALKSKLGKVVSQKQYEESLRVDALGVGAGVIDVEASVDERGGRRRWRRWARVRWCRPWWSATPRARYPSPWWRFVRAKIVVNADRNPS